ncbi:MAG: 3'-5' exonuclease [Bacteroidota bacterium]|nr:3'-5' exonuclease [Bacteroidota bacterium]
MNFLAIDFETADYQPDSACAIGLVRVENEKIVAREAHLINPPRRSMVFTYIHGITLADVMHSPKFKDVWGKIDHLLKDIDFFVAHNAGFDKGVLYACCATSGLPLPATEFECTMRLARKIWKIHPTKLPDVCRRFDISLNHHDAASDSEACARIMIRVLQETGNTYLKNKK